MLCWLIGLDKIHMSCSILEILRSRGLVFLRTLLASFWMAKLRIGETESMKQDVRLSHRHVVWVGCIECIYHEECMKLMLRIEYSTEELMVR